jgi:hypothetical protein
MTSAAKMWLPMAPKGDIARPRRSHQTVGRLARCRLKALAVKMFVRHATGLGEATGVTRQRPYSYPALEFPAPSEATEKPVL